MIVRKWDRPLGDQLSRGFTVALGALTVVTVALVTWFLLFSASAPHRAEVSASASTNCSVVGAPCKPSGVA